MELTIGTTYSSHGRLSSSVPTTATIHPQFTSSDDASFQFSCPKGGVPKGQQSLERRNSMVSPSSTATAKAPKQPKKRRRSSTERTSPVVVSSKNNDILVSPIPVDGLKDMSQPYVSLTDMSFHLGSIPTTINALPQPVNHQVQDFKNCVTFSGNAFDNEQHPAPQYNKDSHKNVSSGDNLNSMINKVCSNVHVDACILSANLQIVQQQSSPSLPLPQHFMLNGVLAGSPGGGLMAMPSPPVTRTVPGNLLAFHPTPPAKISPHNMVPFNPGTH